MNVYERYRRDCTVFFLCLFCLNVDLYFTLYSNYYSYLCVYIFLSYLYHRTQSGFKEFSNSVGIWSACLVNHWNHLCFFGNGRFIIETFWGWLKPCLMSIAAMWCIAISSQKIFCSLRSCEIPCRWRCSTKTPWSLGTVQTVHQRSGFRS